MTDQNVVYIGNKPPMNYVLSVVTQFNSGSQEVHIKARGRAISKAVDVAEITRNKFITDVNVASIETGTDELESREGTKTNVSSIDIVLRK